MSYEQQLCADVRARKARLWNPPAARQPQKMDSPSIAPVPAPRAPDPVFVSAKRLERLIELKNEINALIRKAKGELSASVEPEEPSAPQPQTPFRSIVEAVCIYYDVTQKNLHSHRKSRKIVRPRQIIMYLAKQLTLRSLNEIGYLLGGRDHTTVLHGARRIKELRARDPDLNQQLEELTAILTGKSQEQPHAAP